MKTHVLVRPGGPPSRLVPFLAAGGMLLVALPIFVVAGWSLKAWLLGTVLWVASEGLGILLARLRLGMGSLAASGVVAFGMMFRAIAVMVVLIAVAVSHPRLGLAAALVYALAYTLQLGVSLVTYFAGGGR